MQPREQLMAHFGWTTNLEATTWVLLAIGGQIVNVSKGGGGEEGIHFVTMGSGMHNSQYHTYKWFTFQYKWISKESNCRQWQLFRAHLETYLRDIRVLGTFGIEISDKFISAASKNALKRSRTSYTQLRIFKMS